VSPPENYVEAAFPDEEFLRNVRESRDLGFEEVCSVCGGWVGQTPDDSYHHPGCALDGGILAQQNAEWFASLAARAEAAKGEGGS
jgi:hypothetical protein